MGGAIAASRYQAPTTLAGAETRLPPSVRTLTCTQMDPVVGGPEMKSERFDSLPEGWRTQPQDFAPGLDTDEPHQSLGLVDRYGRPVLLSRHAARRAYCDWVRAIGW